MKILQMLTLSAPFPFVPSPSTLWTLHHDGKMASCELRFLPLGNEARVPMNESPLVSQIVPAGDEALAWAKEERKRLIDAGWVAQ